MRHRCAIAVAILVELAAPLLHAQIRARVQASGFAAPTAFVQDPLDRNIQFVVQQNGRVRVIRNGAVLAADFLDVSGSIVSGGEQGLLGMAFAPNTAASGRFFINFTNRSGDTVVARFRRSDPVVADASSRFDLRWESNGQAFIAQPFANHNGGNLVFGPDGYLYIGLGDGGSGDDPFHNAQNPNQLLGKMLRIDVNVPDSHPTGYQIPPDNPFVVGGPVAARGEIWAFGLRNPWRYSFDDPLRGGAGALVIGDVGQNTYEEVDYEPSNRGGRNYAWRNREGAHDHVTSRPPAYLPLIEPIHEYDHGSGQSITGGYVYRGTALGSAFLGRYFFADFVQGRVWSLALSIDTGTREATASNVTEHTAALSNTGQLGNISAFGLDADGELHLVGYSTGRILKIIGPAAAPQVPSGLRIVRDSTRRLTAQPFVHVHDPVDVGRLDGEEVPPHVVCDLFLVMADAARVNSFDDGTSAVAASKHHLQAARAGRRLVPRLPPDAKAAGVAGERFRLHVAASGPRADFLPDDHFVRRRLWRGLRPAGGNRKRGNEDRENLIGGHG